MARWLILLVLFTVLSTARAQIKIDLKFFDSCEQKVKSLPFTLESLDTLINIPANSVAVVDSGYYLLVTNVVRGEYSHSFYFDLILSKNYYGDTLYLNKVSAGIGGSLHQQVVNHFECTTLCHGTVVDVDSNGIVRSKGQFVNGKPNGRLDYFDENGNLIRREIYRNGYLKDIKKSKTITKGY